jgi:UPF0271 protein
MKYISSANIACGRHAGDIETMKRTVDLAIVNNVAIGAHPGYADRENFGRVSMELERTQIIDLVTTQIHELDKICRDAGAEMAHIKPHGALYNQSANDPDIAAAIAEAVMQVNSNLILFGLSNSHSMREADRIELKSTAEVFADRTYQSDGSLTPRTDPNALITDQNAMVRQVLDLIRYGRVRSVDGIMVKLKSETVCIHGDAEHALRFAHSIQAALSENDIAISSP